MADFWAIFFSWQGQQTGVVVYLIVVLINTLLNILSLRRLGNHSQLNTWPAVAVLVPARDEEANIHRCLTSLLAQDYPDFEVWVLDDHSSDRTPAILAKLAAFDTRLHVLYGAPLPPGWLGKPWACQQLAEAVPVEVPLLLFVDADTWHHPAMLKTIVAMLEAEGLDLLSILPRQVTITLAEKLTVPIIPWSLFSHFPLALAQRFRWPAFAAAIGQVMLFRREAYQAMGGHAAVRREVAEDMALARLAARCNLRWRLLPAPDHTFCRMYRSAPAAWEGFGKNLYAVFGRHLTLYLFIWSWLGIVFLGPWLMLTGALLMSWPVSMPLAALAIGLAAAVWLLTAWHLQLSIAVVPLYPAIMLTAFLLAFHSLGQALTHQATWKTRQVS
ncbi:MAG: glycosyltransferase [Anaerolineae bacterium]|nr:glycosyltransferase [Anaerolineae bacterium]MDW8098424.1 glycosyltransferase [Anaerolineae bacterium]